MKSLLFFAFISFCFVSCENKKVYQYVQVDNVKDLLDGSTSIKEKEPKTIKAVNDSAAYLDAYQSFCIAQKVDEDMAKSLGGPDYNTPKEFKLLDDKGNDITYTVFFASKNDEEKKIREQIFKMKNTLHDAVEKNKTENDVKITSSTNLDSAVIKELSKNFVIKEEEFSNDNKKWYTPKSAPKYTNRNGLYCYFQTDNGIPSNFRLRLQYFSDDWLFFKKVQFLVDGKAFDYIPLNTESDHGDGDIWEWSDEQVGSTDRELILALANAKNAKMKLIGSKYFDIKKITTEQIAGIKRALELYEAMGADF
jgi:hypothetical protein